MAEEQSSLQFSQLPMSMSKKAKRKIQETLRKGIFQGSCSYSASPSCHVLLLNCGFFNGISRCAVHSLIHPTVPVQVLMPSNADHSLVLLSSIREAVALKEKCDSKTVRDLIPPSQQSCVLCDTFLSGPRVTVHAVYVEVLGSLPLMPVIQLALPKGLVVVEDCISKGEEHSLLQILSGDREDVGFDKEKKRDHLKLRRVEHYGYKFEYGSNNVDPEKPLSVPIPKLLYDILKRMLEQKIISYFPDQLTVNEYQAGIPPHVDTHSAFEGEIISLSLGSHCVMDFRQNSSSEKVSVILRPRSLLVMSGESRYFWTHGIAARKLDVIDGSMHGYNSPVCAKSLEETTELRERDLRISCTFRKVKRNPSCDCRHPLCDRGQELCTSSVSTTVDSENYTL